MNKIVLDMQGISKRFPGVKALDQVDFSCHQGEVHALVGENGAGKSTLVKIIAGAIHPDEGKIMFRGDEVHFTSPKQAQDGGISAIYQEFNLIQELNAAENVFLGREPVSRSGFIDESLLYERSKEILNSLGVYIDLRTKIKDLSVPQQQMIEVAKALSLKADILIMDEPSAVVSGKELEALFRIIRSLKEQGKTIIYISHRIDEIFDISDRVTILKDGKLIGVVNTRDVDKPELIRMMVGRSLSDTFPLAEASEKEEERVLVLKNLSKGKSFRNISFNILRGEILGIAGLVGSGRTELARAIFGVDAVDDGEIYFRGKRIAKPTPKLAIELGIGLVPEDRKKEGFVHGLSVKNNLTLPILKKISKWSVLIDELERKISEECVRKFKITTPDIEKEVQYLSGGNQQKVILARWTNTNVKLLIMDEPTRGIDVGSKAEIYKLMRELNRQGTAILMISSELPEILGMSDRVIVMHEGCLMGELSHSEASEEKIMMLATGH
jgi:ribose transport system ATP-binding protein